MKEIVCVDGQKAKVDDDMYEVLKDYVWEVKPDGYAYTFVTKGWNDPPTHAMMHHCVIGHSLYNLVVDHIDRDRLNNQRDNLRHVTNRQNALNSARFDGKPHPEPKKPDDIHWVDRTNMYRGYTRLEDLPPIPEEQMRAALTGLYDPTTS